MWELCFLYEQSVLYFVLGLSYITYITIFNLSLTVRLKNCPRNGCFTVEQTTMTSMHMHLERKNTKNAPFRENTGKKVRLI